MTAHLTSPQSFLVNIAFVSTQRPTQVIPIPNYPCSQMSFSCCTLYYYTRSCSSISLAPTNTDGIQSLHGRHGIHHGSRHRGERSRLRLHRSLHGHRRAHRDRLHDHLAGRRRLGRLLTCRAGLFAWGPPAGCQRKRSSWLAGWVRTFRFLLRNWLLSRTRASLTRLGSVNSTYAYLHTPISVPIFLPNSCQVAKDDA
jgi:hypothetical protein